MCRARKAAVSCKWQPDRLQATARKQVQMAVYITSDAGKQLTGAPPSTPTCWTDGTANSSPKAKRTGSKMARCTTSASVRPLLPFARRQYSSSLASAIQGNQGTNRVRGHRSKHFCFVLCLSMVCATRCVRAKLSVGLWGKAQGPGG